MGHCVRLHGGCLVCTMQSEEVTGKCRCVKLDNVIMGHWTW